MTDEERRKYAAIALKHKKDTAPPCPFQANNKRCHKKGGVCSLRLYEADQPLAEGIWTATVATGKESDLRATCPTRLRQDQKIYQTIGLTVLGTNKPRVVNEIRFLQREPRELPVVPEQDNDDDESSGEDVGNIDNVLSAPDTDPLKWCALELQAVYFSGPKMSALFEHIRDFPSNDLPFPDDVRRPDYRSSGPKRLMPQLQIKVPTLRRWGKRMTIVVDEAFFRNMGRMELVSDLSNCDIAWFLLSFDETTNPASVVVSPPKLQTLERAVEGLTGGLPVTLAEFEAKIKEKLRTSAR